MVRRETLNFGAQFTACMAKDRLCFRVKAWRYRIIPLMLAHRPDHAVAISHAVIEADYDCRQESDQMKRDRDARTKVAFKTEQHQTPCGSGVKSPCSSSWSRQNRAEHCKAENKDRLACTHPLVEGDDCK